MIAWLALIGFIPFAARRLLTYLHLFQQEEYDNRRFLAWLWHDRAFDRRLSATLAVLGAAQLLFARSAPGWTWATLIGIACLGAAAIERDPRRTAKKKLAMTPRATRIFTIAVVVSAAVEVIVAISGGSAFGWLAAVQLIPIALVAGNLVLAPSEARVQRRYWNEAHEKLKRLDPVVIGITGSYGKTSIKHILGHVLGTAAPTLITPGSVNTAMGIARVIRESLQPHHRYLIVEMGAYGIGSIKQLCALAPPKLGIISAIGKAHYERFKSLDAVAQTKFELAEAARDNGGSIVVAGDTLQFAYSRDFAEQHRETVVTVGDEASDLVIETISQAPDGVTARIHWAGQAYTLSAPLFGLHHGRNIALAFAAASRLGLSPEDIVASLKSTPQIAHRLEVKRQGDGSIVIDDAYNSNPVGFASALALLDTLQRDGGRRILVTPGMVELGDEHENEHARIGRLAAEHVDVLVAVAPHRVAPLVTAFAAAAPRRPVVPCSTFHEAESWLADNLGGRDVVLIENDLPDLLERPLRL